jgi:hypothetical protein
MRGTPRIPRFFASANSAYAAVLKSIEQDLKKLVKSNDLMFTFKNPQDGLVDIRDFQTTGVVAFARGCPFYDLEVGKLDVGGRRVRVNESQRQLCEDATNELVSRL